MGGRGCLHGEMPPNLSGVLDSPRRVWRHLGLQRHPPVYETTSGTLYLADTQARHLGKVVIVGKARGQAAQLHHECSVPCCLILRRHDQGRLRLAFHPGVARHYDLTRVCWRGEQILDEPTGGDTRRQIAVRSVAARAGDLFGQRSYVRASGTLHGWFPVITDMVSRKSTRIRSLRESSSDECRRSGMGSGIKYGSGPNPVPKDRLARAKDRM
jgi:hypothetical protein